MSRTIRQGDQVLLYQDPRRKWVTRVSGEKFHTHRGFVNLETLVGMKPGGTVTTSMGHSLWVFEPTLTDLLDTFDRPTQILYPKDVAYALYMIGVKPGHRAVEVGTGSGAMTTALARAVDPGGHVYSYENRPEFLEVARRNLEKTGLSSIVTLHSKDPTEGFDEVEADVAVLDVGDPWKMVGAFWTALVEGGMLAAFTPTFNQLEKLEETLRKGGFLLIEAVEVLIRQMKTEAGKIRPESRMVGHTAYITIARKIQPGPS